MEGKSGIHIFAVCLLILLCFSGSGFSAVFDGGGEDFYWCNPDNWDIGILPGPADSVRIGSMGDCVIIDCDVDIPSLDFLCDPYMCLTVLSGIVNIGRIERNECEGDLYFNFLGGTTTINDSMRIADEGWTHWVISGGTLLINGGVRVGDNGGTGWNVNMDSGVLVFGGQVEIDDDGGGIWNLSGTASVSFLDNFQPHLRDGDAVFELNISGNAEMVVVKTLSTNDKEGGNGLATINIDGGILSVGENLELGDNGSGNLNITAGLLVVGGTLELNTGNANLIGGVVRAGDLDIDDGVVNIEPGGTLILEGNKITKVAALARDGKLLGCGSWRMGCSGGPLMVDYGITNPGKTTLTASCYFDMCQACWIEPADGATEVRAGLTTGGVTLSWNEGDCIGMRGSNALYFGTDYDCVKDGDTSSPCFIDDLRFYGDPASWNAGNLPLWETYYWRVDQYNFEPSAPPLTNGDVWSFTTGCELKGGDVNMDCLVNFLDFAELTSTFGQEEFWPE